MTPKLTDEQRTAVEEHGGRPVPIVDPASQAVFYLVSDRQFNQVRALLENEQFDVRETYPAQEAALRGVWDDPALDIYNDREDASEV